MTDNIIVLGGSGFLGSQIINSLNNNNFKNITCGDSFKNPQLLHPFIEIDILNLENLSEQLRKYNIVINCLGAISTPFNRCFKLNTRGILNLSRAIRESNIKIIHISSVAVYGTADIVNENSILSPETNYGTSKANAEFILQNYVPKENLTILRLSNLFGFNQKKGLVSYLLKSYNSNKVLNFNNNGNLKRSYLNVEDCSTIITKFVKNYRIHGIFNISGDENCSIKEVVNLFEKFLGIAYQTKFNDVKPWDNIIKIDKSKLKKNISYNCVWNFENFLLKHLENKS